MDLKSDPPAPDPYEGVGGCYVIDPATGRRVQVVAPPDMPQVAQSAPQLVATVQTSALDRPAAKKDDSF